ncbi:alpha/beta hydrolase [Luteolibacter ambystomatis]|uniref:Alpha/beta hydrolase n=1 Tax=Luteolibacter ambystomatis TaxID=2824561 RepID=A0A975J1P5_9BACT|nr:alpha/beta hydrolase [Luteolibacter ambystomatis]QUE52402.1 alpha/beta hydrolase [Luteolibacter ambystomatis]
MDGTDVLSREFAGGDWHGHPVTVLPIPKEGAQDYESLVTALAPQLPEGPLVLIGESFSGPIAMKLAKRERGRVEALVIAGGFCASPAPAGLALVPLRPLFLLPPPAIFLKKYLAGPEATHELVESLGAAIRSVPSATLSARAEVILALQESDCPSFESLPVLLVQAHHDEVLSWESQSRLERHFPEADSVWIESPHLLLATNPDVCREAVVEFLSRVPA